MRLCSDAWPVDSLTMATLLSFDTSTDSMSIALQSPQGLWLHEAEGGARASATLIPAILALLAEAGCSLAQLDAIAFGCGPGAFTGLRTACSVAQGLALGAAKPVIAVDSLLLVAQDARSQCPAQLPFDVWVAMDARMGEIYAAAYRWDGTHWRVRSAPALVRPEALNACWQTEAPQWLAGSALAAFGERLHAGAATRLAQPRSRASALAELAQQLWAAGQTLDAAHAWPVYLRDKVAQTTAEREAERMAKAVAP